MKCNICKKEYDETTTIYVRDEGKQKIEIEICQWCGQTLLAELLKQFVIETYHLNLKK